MFKVVLSLVLFCFMSGVFAQTEYAEDKEVKVRKMTYNDFVTKHSINDTSAAVIALFFNKKSDAAYGQMSFLPISAALFLLPPTHFIGLGLSVITIPLFINGTLILYKYRKKKLLKVLETYKATGELPGWIRRKTLRSMEYQQFQLENY